MWYSFGHTHTVCIVCGVIVSKQGSFRPEIAKESGKNDEAVKKRVSKVIRRLSFDSM